MTPLLRHSYHDNDIFLAEQEHIFAARIFAGTEQDFTATDSYNSFRIGRHALTCRATADGVRAFNNVCLHRNALIDPQGSGQRPFRCGYHGWSYDTNGKLKHAPLSEPACIHTRQLQEFPVVPAGQLLFLSLTGTAPEVDEIPGLLQRTGLELDIPFHRGELQHECNWKLLVENVLEGYHLNFVHERSFVSSGFNSQTSGTLGNGHYTSWSHATPGLSNVGRALSHFPGTAHHYLHGFIFPNVFVANTNNLIGFLSFLLPLSPSKTLLRWQLSELPALRALPDNIREQVRVNAIATAQQVLREDKEIVESCQIGCASEGMQIQLQPSENRIANFHQMYMKRMASIIQK